MFFDFEDRHFDTPTVESAISWREQLLASAFAHLAALFLVLFGPSLPFVQEAVERRAERLAELAAQAELRPQVELEDPGYDDRTFVFIAPRSDIEADEAPQPDAPLSDQDRVAQSPLRTLDPENRLPIADGNSLEFVETDDPDDGLDSLADASLEDTDNEEAELEAEVPADPTEESRLADATAGVEEAIENSDALSDDPGLLPEDQPAVGTVADSSLTNQGSGPGDPDEPDLAPDVEADGLLGQVRETLRRSVRQRSFGNVSGDTGRYGPEIQFDSKGVEFGPWIRRFVAQIRRNWFIPYSVLSNHGHVVLTFNVHRDGRLTDLSVLQPSGIESFNRSASNALRMSNPTQPLPAEYPDEQVFFTVTFYYNERPPGR